MAEPGGGRGLAEAGGAAGGRRRLEALLNRSLRIRMSDGRTLVGAFLCTDRAANVILGSAQEFLKASDAFPGSEPRVLGLAMVPGHHIVSIEVERDGTGGPPTPDPPGHPRTPRMDPTPPRTPWIYPTPHGPPGWTRHPHGPHGWTRHPHGPHYGSPRMDPAPHGPPRMDPAPHGPPRWTQHPMDPPRWTQHPMDGPDTPQMTRHPPGPPG